MGYKDIWGNSFQIFFVKKINITKMKIINKETKVKYICLFGH